MLALLSPWTAVALCASAAAFYASARSLQDGEAVTVIALTGTAMSVCCIAGGILVFGDPLPGDPVGIVAPGRRLPARDRRLGAHPGSALRAGGAPPRRARRGLTPLRARRAAVRGQPAAQRMLRGGSVAARIRSTARVVQIDQAV